MKVSDKTLTFDKNLWVRFDGVDAKETGGQVKLTARDEEAYLKVFNHFGRVLKLFTFEDGQWVDSDTGMAARPFDEAQAGHLPGAAPGAARIKTVKNKAAKKKAAKPAVRKSAAAKKTKAPAGKANTRPAGKKSVGESKTPKS